MMAEARKAKLSEQTADRLYELIVDEGRYPLGSKLPNENELSQALQVSRTTLREAISFLVAQGVLEIRRGKGTFVKEALPSQGLDLTGLAGMRSRVRAKDLFEMRLIFEPATVALACSRATDEELEQIVKKGRRVEQVAAEGGDWPLADQEFHWAIIKASHNEYMRRLYPIINSAVNEILQIAHNRQKMQDTALADNRIILDFLLKRDEVGASHAMSIHMRHLINTENAQSRTDEIDGHSETGCIKRRFFVRDCQKKHPYSQIVHKFCVSPFQKEKTEVYNVHRRRESGAHSGLSSGRFPDGKAAVFRPAGKAGRNEKKGA